MNIPKLIRSRLEKLAADFPEFSGQECSELLRMEAECIQTLLMDVLPGNLLLNEAEK